MKRYQDSNWIVKLWRRRHYVYVPFKYVWNMYLSPIRIPETAYDDELCVITTTGEEYVPKGKNLWSLLIGSAQIDMNWTFTSEEVFAKFDLKRDKSDSYSGCYRGPIDHGDVDEY